MVVTLGQQYNVGENVVSHIQRIGCQPEKTTLHGGQSHSWSVGPTTLGDGTCNPVAPRNSCGFADRQHLPEEYLTPIDIELLPRLARRGLSCRVLSTKYIHGKHAHIYRFKSFPRWAHVYVLFYTIFPPHFQVYIHIYILYEVQYTTMISHRIECTSKYYHSSNTVGVLNIAQAFLKSRTWCILYTVLHT